MNCKSCSGNFMLKGLTPSVGCIISDRKSTFPTDLKVIHELKILKCDFPFVVVDDNNSPHFDFYFFYCVFFPFWFRDTLVSLWSHISEDQRTWLFLLKRGIDLPKSGLKCASILFSPAKSCQLIWMADLLLAQRSRSHDTLAVILRSLCRAGPWNLYKDW